MEYNKFKNYFITPQLKPALALTFGRVLCVISVYTIFFFFFLLFLSLKLLQECAQFLMVYEMFSLLRTVDESSSSD